MRLFGRDRSRAEARVVSVATADAELVCELEVRPPIAAPFASTLRTRHRVVQGAMTYVLYDADDPSQCALDEPRLRAAGIRDGRAYFAVNWEQPVRSTVSRGDAKDKLARLDALTARRAAGEITDAEHAVERERVLGRPVTA
jgi:hypothetical protein